MMKILTSKIWYVLLMAALFAGIWFAIEPVTAEAASTPYQKIEVVEREKPVKVGKYYFRTVANKDDNDILEISKKKYSGYSTVYEANWIGNIVTNGKNIYYVEEDSLYRYNISKKNNKRLKKLPVKGDASYQIGAAYGKNVYVTRSSLMEWRMDTYMYNTASKKYKKVKSNYAITDQYGKHVIGREEYRSDVSAYPIRVCKLKSSGISKGKRLTAAGFSETYIKNKLYYTKSSDVTMSDTTLYRAKANGTKKTVLGKFYSSEEYGQAIVIDITSKNCIVYKDGKQYKYTYKTKKLKEIQ